MEFDCLIVDDEKELAVATCEYFQMFGLSTTYVTNANDCYKILEENTVHLILLDINLENESGFLLCKKVREFTNIPIIFISARQSDDDVIIALNIGGDDYIKKPYSLSVLLAKVKVVLKRYKQEKSSVVEVDGPFKIDSNAMKVYMNGQDVEFKTKEFKLFQYLFENKNKLMTKNEIFSNVWGDEFFSDGTLNVHIRKIREKIEENPNEPKIIKTVWGTGYILELVD